MAYSFVQGYNGGGNVLSSSGTPSTANIAFQTQNTASGNLLIVVFRTNIAGGSLSSITDDQGNTWTFTEIDAAALPTYFGYALKTVGGTKANLTLTFTSAQSVICPVLGEYSGVSAFRAHDAGNAGTTGNPTSATVTCQVGDLLIGYMGSATVKGLSQGSGYTLRETFVFSGTTDEAAFEDATAASTTPTASFGQTTSGAWAAGIFAFHSTANTKTLTAATASLAAVLLKSAGKAFTAATASLAATLSRKTTAILTAATASMAGVLLKRTGKAFAAATASLAATLTRALTNVITFIASTASMAATLTRQTGKALVAAISSFAAQLIKRTSYFLMAATASFAATLTRATAQSFIAATTLFSATLNRSTVKTITAAMSSFAAAINKKISLIFAAATSSFSASISEGLEFSVFFTAAMALFSAILSTLLKKNPFVNRGPAVKRFGVSSVFPAVISTATNDLIFFEQPEPMAFTNQDLVQLNLPAAGSGTADDWGGLGQRIMAGKLLVAPGNGRLGGKIYLLAASGDITVPSSASSATVNLILNQNDFSVAGQVVLTVSNMIATTGVPVSLNPGTVSWSLACTLRDNGVHNSFLEGRFTFTIDQNSYSGVLQVRVPGNEEPQLQLSLGAQFGGTVSGSDMFQIRATQYELQQLGLPNKTNQASI